MSTHPKVQSFLASTQVHNKHTYQTQKFYEKIMDKVCENVKEYFLVNGVSDKIHEKLKKVGTFL